MESWRNRKTLILGRSDMVGLRHSGGVRRLRRARLPHARRGTRLHGAEGPHRPRPLQGRVGGDAVVHRGAGGGAPASGSRSARTTRATSFRRSSRSSIYTHPETGFPLAICDGSYHTLMRTGASAAVSAKWLARQGLEGARDPRDRERRRGHARDVRHRSSPGRRCASGAARRRRSTASSPSRRRGIPHLAHAPARPTSNAVDAAPT